MGSGNSTCYSEAQSDDKDEFKKPNAPSARVLTRRESCLSTYSTENQHVIEPPIIFGAFNIQSFGVAKMSNERAVKAIVKIIRHFDIIVLQEIVDKSEKAINKLLDEVNNGLHSSASYKFELSPRVGRSTAKEQYAVFYKQSRCKVKKCLLYTDDKDDVFSRDPFVVLMEVPCIGDDSSDVEISEIAIVAIHTSPNVAVKEIEALDEVRKWVTKRTRTTNVLIAGDLNASRPYVYDWDKCPLRDEKKYEWYIKDHVDTTATGTMAAYDRIIGYGKNLPRVVEPDSGRAFRYDEESSFCGNENIIPTEISDHYPVEITFKSKTHPLVQSFINVKQQIDIEDVREVEKWKAFRKINEDLLSPFLLVGDGKTYDEVCAEFSNVDSAKEALTELRSNIQGIISYSMIASVKHQLDTLNKNAIKISSPIEIRIYRRDKKVHVLINA